MNQYEYICCTILSSLANMHKADEKYKKFMQMCMWHYFEKKNIEATVLVHMHENYKSKGISSEKQL